ncbi:MAG TPA: hypothetical protein VI564_06390 [Candidatus Nanoarchaeia archaeon]|nr:hypothetical protein [Candidatus Nanoarchaeia archaeon]
MTFIVKLRDNSPDIPIDEIASALYNSLEENGAKNLSRGRNEVHIQEIEASVDGISLGSFDYGPDMGSKTDNFSIIYHQGRVLVEQKLLHFLIQHSIYDHHYNFRIGFIKSEFVSNPNSRVASAYLNHLENVESAIPFMEGVGKTLSRSLGGIEFLILGSSIRGGHQYQLITYSPKYEEVA